MRMQGGHNNAMEFLKPKQRITLLQAAAETARQAFLLVEPELKVAGTDETQESQQARLQAFAQKLAALTQESDQAQEDFLAAVRRPAFTDSQRQRKAQERCTALARLAETALDFAQNCLDSVGALPERNGGAAAALLCGAAKAALCGADGTVAKMQDPEARAEFTARVDTLAGKTDQCAAADFAARSQALRAESAENA